VSAAVRAATADPRIPILERYESRDAYLAKYRAAAQQLIDSRFLLPSDLDPLMKRAEQLWDWIVEKRSS
jgi:hypothetical protein